MNIYSPLIRFSVGSIHNILVIMSGLILPGYKRNAARHSEQVLYIKKLFKLNTSFNALAVVFDTV